MFDDTLQICPRHRVLQTLAEPCPKCMAEILEEQRHRAIIPMIMAEKELTLAKGA